MRLTFLEALHLSHIYLIPPVDIWESVIKLRSHINWSDVRPIVQSEVNKSKHLSYNSNSTRASELSHRSLAHSSSTSFNSQKNRMSSSSVNFEQSQHHVSEDSHSRQPTRSDTIRGPSVARPVRKNGQASKKAPRGWKFTCPFTDHSQCRKWTCSREKDFYRHIQIEHPGEWAFDAWELLKFYSQDAPTPAKSDTTDASATLQQESPCSMHEYAEVNASNDFSPTSEDYHLPMQTLMPPSEYYGHTGIHNVQVTNNSYFNFSDEMEDK